MENWDNRIGHYYAALSVRPESSPVHNNLAFCLQRHGDHSAALRHFRKALECDPLHIVAHIGLAQTFLSLYDFDGAEKQLHIAVDLADKYASDPIWIGQQPEIHLELGIALVSINDLDGAIAEFRKALRLKKDYPRAARWLHNAERMAALGTRLPKLVEGKEQPADPVECLALAELCQRYKYLFAASARWYRAAFALQPDLADDPPTWNRYNAACVAALAGCGQGQDADPLSDQERAGLRKQALDWLSADLRAWRTLLEKGPEKSRAPIAQALMHWLEDTDFNGVRGAGALAKLAEAEREPWRKLWADVAATLARAQEKGGTAEKTAVTAEARKKD
jgi:tetratricopeptide (TPR) repeat protein